MAGEPQDPVKRRLRITILVWVVLLVAVAIAIALLGDFGVASESPNYEVTETIGEVEIRKYAPYLVAETRVDGSLEDAGNQGFRILAKYIFGDNRGKQKIAMTAPVSQEKTDGVEIAMTAPVTQRRAGEQFTIQFMMPSEYSLETLPEPNDSRIEIREVPGRRLAAIRYSGRWSEKNYEENLKKLLETLSREGYEPEGEPVWARYDPPFKPWFMRRNEILTAFREP
jgi:effector-binding domain-containing protein